LPGACEPLPPVTPLRGTPGGGLRAPASGDDPPGDSRGDCEPLPPVTTLRGTPGGGLRAPASGDDPPDASRVRQRTASPAHPVTPPPDASRVRQAPPIR
ncbi:MAG: hypothetical protein LBT40_00410, partial [Deltaproteobacteria bacterium]|nr:hypothetical protein [Deltaproteobacteria bacterium]